MLSRRTLACLGVGLVAAAASVLAVPAIDPALQPKVDEQVKYVQGWASDPAIVAAVKATNAGAPAANKAMTQEKWAALQPFDPFVLSFSGSPVGQFLKTQEERGDQRGVRVRGGRHQGRLPAEVLELEPQGQAEARRPDDREDVAG